jgi:hypothetical protein
MQPSVKAGSFSAEARQLCLDEGCEAAPGTLAELAFAKLVGKSLKVMQAVQREIHEFSVR